MKDVISVLKFTKPFKRTIFTICVMIVTVSIAKQINPWITKNATDIIQMVVEGTLNSHEAVSRIIKLMSVALIVAWINWLANRVSWHKSGVLIEKLKGHLRVIAFRHLLNNDTAYFDNLTSGSTMSKLDRGINRITGQINEITGFFLPNILSAIIAIVLITRINPIFVLLMLIGFVPFIIINTIALRKYEPVEKKWNKIYDDEYGHFWEVLSSIRLVKSFNRIKYEMRRMFEFNKKDIEFVTKAEKIWDFSSIKDFILDTWIWGLTLYLIVQTINGAMTIGTFFLLFQYTYILREPIWNLTWMYFEFRRMIIGSKDYMKIINRLPTILDSPNPIIIKDVKGSITFDNVDFGYKKDKLILNKMSFDIKPGETIALVAKSGGGKTTIANLINRFYDISGGSIFIDGIDIRKIEQKSLREQIGLVLQESYLFNDTIKSNLLYGKLDATTDELIKACKMANAWEFIKDLQKGFNTKIGERGIQLSGGQKQRLSIARTILKNPPILILDEATSSLDSESEFKVQQAIEELIKNRTTIIIAHRLSTIQKADRIFVINNGKIEESGNHNKLLRIKNGIYQRLYKMQTSKDKSKVLEEYELE